MFSGATPRHQAASSFSQPAIVSSQHGACWALVHTARLGTGSTGTKLGWTSPRALPTLLGAAVQCGDRPLVLRLLALVGHSHPWHDISTHSKSSKHHEACKCQSKSSLVSGKKAPRNPENRQSFFGLAVLRGLCHFWYEFRNLLIGRFIAANPALASLGRLQPRW